MKVKHCIEGLDDFTGDLRAMSKALDGGEAMKDANYAVGMVVVDAAKSRAGGLGRMEAKAAQSLTAGRAQRAASVAIGGAKFPFALGAEFGSDRYRQFRPWRGSGKTAGYWLWPAVRSEGEQIERVYAEALDDITRRAFPS